MKNAILLVFLLLGFVLFAQKPGHATADDKAVAQFVPDTSLSYKQFFEELATLKKTPNNQEVWVVSVWASHNSKSLLANTNLKKTYTKFHNKPVRFVGASFDKNTTVWYNAMVKQANNFEHFRIPQDNMEDFQKTFSYKTPPALFIIDRRGSVKKMKDITDLNETLANEAKTLPDTIFVRPSLRPAKVEPPKVEKPKVPTVAELTAQGWVLHKVKKGDTLYNISRGYNVDQEELKTLNGLTSNAIKLDQILKIKQNEVETTPNTGE